MDIALLALVGVVAVLLVVVLLRQGASSSSTAAERQDVESLRAEMRDNLNQVRETVQTQMGGIRTEMTGSMTTLRQEMGTRLDTTGSTINRVQTQLGELTEATKHIQEISKDIASLQDILKPPKLRGTLGELLLERLLSQILPADSYTLQHRFLDGKVVDAVIVLGKGQLVPVDSKFPLDSFRRLAEAAQETERTQYRREFVRSVRQHVDRVAEYIRPDEGTLNFALMYVPAENVFYETIIKSEEVESDLYNYALERRVMPVSPHSFYAYLGAIALGLKGMAIEQSAKQVLEHLSRLDSEFGRVNEDFRTLGTHLTHASNKYSETQRRLERFGDRLTALPDPEALGQLEAGVRQEDAAP